MEQLNDINHNIQDMPAHTSLSMILIKNFTYLLALAFYPLMDYLMQIVPDWKANLENFKLIGGAIIVVLVIAKLLLEILKLVKK